MPSGIGFYVNNRAVAVAAAPETPLIYALRNDLGLKATRFGCGEGICGACTVLVDDHPVTSCDYPLGSVAGARVRTLEGLSNGNGRHPLQAALIEAQAGQCGYCLGGIIMRLAAFFDREPEATAPTLAKELDAHLCRCGSHPRIVRAAQRAFEARGAGRVA